MQDAEHPLAALDGLQTDIGVTITVDIAERLEPDRREAIVGLIGVRTEREPGKQGIACHQRCPRRRGRPPAGLAIVEISPAMAGYRFGTDEVRGRVAIDRRLHQHVVEAIAIDVACRCHRIDLEIADRPQVRGVQHGLARGIDDSELQRCRDRRARPVRRRQQQIQIADIGASRNPAEHPGRGIQAEPAGQRRDAVCHRDAERDRVTGVDVGETPSQVEMEAVPDVGILRAGWRGHGWRIVDVGDVHVEPSHGAETAPVGGDDSQRQTANVFVVRRPAECPGRGIERQPVRQRLAVRQSHGQAEGRIVGVDEGGRR